MPRIVVTRQIAADATRALGDDVWVSPHDRPLAPDELRGAVAGAEGMITMLYDRVDAALLDAAGPQLKIVANMAVGFDNIDLQACLVREVAVSNTPGVLVDATADLALALMLAVTRRLGEGERLIRSGAAWSWDVDLLLGRGLREKTLGIVGYGQIGQGLALRARALGMRIVYSQRRRAAPGLEQDAVYLPLAEVFGTADVVSLHCPLTPQTFHLIGEDALSAMRSSAVLINTARGPIVDESALVAALQQGTIAAAGLDVYEDEPRVHPGLLALENVVLLPHLGSATTETRSAMANLAVRNVLTVLAGRPAPTSVTVGSPPPNPAVCSPDG